MALIPCPECHKEVSTEARACPQCAFPFPGKHAVEEERAAGLNTCPQCHGLVSPDAHTCPYCRVSLTGKPTPKKNNGEAIQETLVCPHCRESYIHTRKVPPPVKGPYEQTDLTPSLTSWNQAATIGPRDSQGKNPGKSTEFQGPRRRAALWQDPSGPQKLASPRRYPRGRKKSILIGLILLVTVAMSVVLGAIWQLDGLNPLEAILSWRM